MTANGWIQILLFSRAVLLVTVPLGAFMHRVLEGQRHFLQRPLGWLERLVYRAGGVDRREQSWQVYTAGLLAFSAIAMLVTYAIQRLQHVLPFNPQGMGPVEASSSFNTAASFTTNTNWQGYVGEATMSYLSQMAGLAWHNFISAAAGIAIAVALARGITRKGDGKGPGTIGNFWVDLTRATVYVLLPLSVVFALVFVSQGMIQNLAPYQEAATLEGGKQLIAGGPFASQEAIKQLGTNGGGPLNANAAHPFENPNPLTNFLSMFLIFAIPAGLTYTFGRMAGDQRHGWALFGAMAFMFLAGVAVAYWAEAAGNPIVTRLGVDPGLGNMEGKEVRFGVASSALYVPLPGSDGPVGVLGVQPRDDLLPMSPAHFDLLETLARLIAAPLERGRLAAAAEKARLEAETERMRSTLLGSVSHDFRTPLAAITGAASSLLGTTRLDESARLELGQTIYEEAVRLDRLVANLLDMTRLESGAVRPAREWHSLEEIVGTAARRMDKLLAGRRLTISLPADLPLLFLDAVLIEQLFVNLLDNAAKYTPAASTIHISAEYRHDEVRVEVADDGPGLPPGDEQRVFEKFFRRSAIRGGVGLGLAICRAVVEAHGGRIWAENRSPSGVAFHFTLPAAGTPPPPQDAPDDRPS